MDPDEFINKLMAFMPESWDDENAPESIVIDFVEAITARLMDLGGSLERYPEE